MLTCPQCGYTCENIDLSGLIPASVNLQLPDGTSLFSANTLNTALRSACESYFPAYSQVRASAIASPFPDFHPLKVTRSFFVPYIHHRSKSPILRSEPSLPWLVGTPKPASNSALPSPLKV